MTTKYILGVGIMIIAFGSKAAPFSFLHPDYQQELIVTTAIGGQAVAGVTLGLDGLLYTNGNGSPGISVWDPSNRVTINGSSVSSLVTSINNSSDDGWGITIDNTGNLYMLGSNRLYQVDKTTLSSTFVGNAGTYGLAYDRATDSFYSSSGNSIIHTMKDGSSNTIVANTQGFIDQVAIDPTGNYIAGAECCSASTGSIHIWDIHTGVLVVEADLNPDHAPDGLAFDTHGNIFTNNTDGTVTRIEFNSGYSAGSTGQTLIASGGFYGDLAGVGADGAFYLSQYGTRFDNGTTSSFSSIVKLSLVGGGGFVDGGTGGTNVPPNNVPEPGTLALLGLGLLGFVGMRRFAA